MSKDDKHILVTANEKEIRKMNLETHELGEEVYFTIGKPEEFEEGQDDEEENEEDEPENLKDVHLDS